MESLVITTDCITLGSEIARALMVLNGFVRDVREARADVDGISRELHSLQSMLDLLKDDAGFLPYDLAIQTPGVLDHCSMVVDELDVCLALLNGDKLTRQEKRKHWIAHGRQDSNRFRTSLEAHRSIIGLALDFVGATVVRDPTADPVQRKPIGGDVMEDVSRMLADISTLRLHQPKEFSKNDSDCTLYNFMNCLESYGEDVVRGTGYENVRGAFVGENEMFGAYVGDSPDSAIDLYEAPPFNSLREALTKNLEENGLYVTHDDEVHGASDDDLSPVSSRAPTPPPRSRDRLEGQRRNTMTPASSDTTAQSLYLEHTTTSGGSPPLKSYPPPVLENSRFKKFMGHVSKRSFSDLRPDSRMTIASSAYTGTTVASTDPRPSTPVIQASLVRRGGEKLSVSIKKLPMWSNDLEELTNPDANTVFGVSLSKSIQIAKATAKTHHNGTGSSRRDFPLCIHMCCTFLKNEGVEAPEIFSETGDPLRVHKLKEIFSRPPTYGEDINWTNFGVYDAADLILLYLAQLPRPLVSEMTAKRWIKLSRQATISGSKGTRADQCIDFWEEALGTLRGPSRSLFKLLLNLWAEIAEAADSNDMTAERLADVLLKPLMHNFTYKHKTDYMLAVAFMIRKRIEYQNMLKDEQKEARRARQMGW